MVNTYMHVHHVLMLFGTCRKRQLDEEQKQIDAIKKEKEWKQEWDVSIIIVNYCIAHIFHEEIGYNYCNSQTIQASFTLIL